MRKVLNAVAGLATGVATLSLFVAPVFAQRAATTSFDDAAAASAIGGFVIVYYLCLCCLVVLGLAIKIWNAYSISKDAEYKKMDNGVLWAILYFIFGDFALAVYFWQQKSILKNEVPMGNKEEKAPKAEKAE